MYHILFYIFIILYGLYAYKIYLWLDYSLNQKLSYFYEIDPELPENCKPFARFDRKKWNHFEIYFCAIFLLPLRIFLVIFFTICYTIVILICDKIWTSKTEQTPLQRKIIKLGGNILARSILFCAGFYYISLKKAQISSYLPEYQPPANNNNLRAPMIITNHYSWLDIFYLISSKYCPSYLSKKDVIKYPLIGKIAIGLQSLFVERENRAEKDQILTLIEERCSKILNGENYPSILIFPEGTTTNGQYLISFKKGAFVHINPIQIICLKYEERNFALSYDGIGDIYCFVFTFCQFWNKLTVTEFDVFDPTYLKLNKNSEDDWMIYMKKVKEVMLKCLGAQNSEAGFNDKKEYYTKIRTEMKERENMQDLERQKIQAKF